MSIGGYDILSIMRFVLLALILMFPTTVFAASEFSTSFESIYTIQESGETSVTHNIDLKNNLAHIYATEYTIQTNGEDLKNISAIDETGDITTETISQNGITSIHMLITRPSIGKDQVKNIKLSYQTSDVLEQIGSTKTVNIPRLEKANESENYKRIVKIKGVQDVPEYIYPPANSKIAEDGYSVYFFDGHQGDSLTLLFGESVTYKLNLIYELKNNEISSSDTEMALPSDTSYQHIILDSIDPKPKSIKVDSDGNWLARYNLESQSKILVKVTMFATIYPIPKLIDPSSAQTTSSLKSKYWQTNTMVADLGAKLKTPENIYKYLVDNFAYNYTDNTTRRDRLGAIAALTSPSNVLCTEFTDSFVALTRTQNIASREINGFGYTKNGKLLPQNSNTDILHAWPEYYDADKKIWISVDPTWGNTTGGVNYFSKLDYSHIVFVRHGLEDSYPLAAGAYKSNVADKSIIVEVASTIPEEISNTENINNVITNTGNVAISNSEIGYLPPYGSIQINSSKRSSLYDKIMLICAKLLSIF